MKKVLLILLVSCISLMLQAQVFKTVNITAGGLSAALTAVEKSTVTDLTITGTIDARDFKTMRDSMVVLSIIDLETSNIIAYKGINGTYEPSNQTIYPINEIPREAFNDDTILTSIIMPSTITTIGDNAFFNCKGIRSITIPHSVVTINSFSFTCCGNNSTVYIPANVLNIIPDAFVRFNGSIIVDENNPNYSSIDGVLFNKKQTVLMQCPTIKAGTYTIPSSVTSINGQAFSYCVNLNSVIFPEFLISIGSQSFEYCKGLSGTLNFPSSLSSIGSLSFSNCENLSLVYIPSSVITIEYIAFMKSSAEIIVDENNPNYSSKDAVLFNKTQTTLIHYPNRKAGVYIIPSSVLKIDYDAFYDCSKLTTVFIPSSVTHINDEAFKQCSAEIVVDENNPNYSSKEGVLFNKQRTTLINCPTGRIGYFTVPSTVTYIYKSAFSYCEFLISVSIPSSVNWISYLAFENCSGLTTIYSYSTIPDDIIMGLYPFLGVDLNTCILYVPYGLKHLYEVADQWKDFTHIVEMPFDPTITTVAGELYTHIPTAARDTLTTLTIKGTIDARDFRFMRDSLPMLAVLDIEDVDVVAYSGTEGTYPSILNRTNYPANTIPYYAFVSYSQYTGNGQLTIVKLPLSIVAIGTSSFSYCRVLSIIIIPPLVQTIGDNAFSFCYKLTSINIPVSVNYIGIQAFAMCRILSQVVIPRSVNYIGSQAFRDLGGPIEVDENNPSYSDIDGVLFNKSKSELIQCPISKTGTYSITGSVSTIGEFAFSGCIGLAEITIPSSVFSIEESAFVNCKSLAYYNIPLSVNVINDGVFRGCNSLKTVIIPETIDSIKAFAFDNCHGLASLTIPSTVNEIGNNAFSYCEKLTSIYAFRNIPVDLSSSTNVFFNVDTTTCTLYVPYGSKPLYETADQWKDFENIVEMPGFSLSDTTITISYKGSTDSIVINSNTTWALASDQQWLTISSAAGTGNDSLIFTVVANQSSIPRTALVTVSAEGVPDQTITVLQEANLALLAVDENYLNIGADEGSTASVKVTSNIFWNVTSNQTWLIPGSALGTGNDTLIFTAKANPSTIPRFATVTISAEGVANQIITVLQEAAAATLTVLEKNVNIGPDEGSTASAMVASNTNWTTTSNKQWLTINSATGTGNAPLIFTAHENPSIIPRVATVTVSTEGLTPQTITVTQEAVYTSSTLLVSPTLVIIAADEGSTASVIIAAKLPWTATSSETWLTKTPKNGIGNDTLVFTSKANLSSYDRPARVIITANDASVQTITVIQLAKFKLSAVEISKENITLFPNPVTDGFRINGVEGKAEITISDLSGKLLLSKEIEGNEYVSATLLAKGVYIVRITNVEGRIEKKLIKE
jgi:hypothetical protein